MPSDPLTSRARLIAGLVGGPGERIARPVSPQLGVELGKLLEALAMDVVELADDQVREALRLLVVRRPWPEPEIGDLALGEDDPELLDLVADRPESHRPQPGRVDPDHPAQRPGAGIHRHRLQPPSQRRELGIERIEHEAGLDDHMVSGDLDDLPEMAAEIDHQPRTERSPSRVRPRPPGMQGDPMLGRVTDDRRHVVLGPRDDHPQGIDLVQAGVVRVGGPIEGLEIELADDESPQVIENPRTMLIHG